MFHSLITWKSPKMTMQFAALRTDRLSSASVTVGEVRDRLKSSVRSISVINFVSHYKNLKPDWDHLEKIRTWEFVKRKLSNVLNNWWDTVQGCNFNNESAHFWIFWHQTTSSVLDSLSQLSQLSVVLCKCSDVEVHGIYLFIIILSGILLASVNSWYRG